MALLELRDIGKIYVSEGHVSVGIRGVNLSFSLGEFVAVTGKSGSGKSTLLNVISGMDSYEEGELLIEGEPTSHYMQPDWEEYREKYISFIFQDYNIIESFTVLQNVELALMHIEDKAERRARAMELIRRVGLASHADHKGSKLSGGQKQRTVIARALAKDSPIILADEPTGNLDSKTSAEIIALLKEVSEEKLLIVVTHNFDQVAEHATRHIRIFDGAVEADHAIKPAGQADERRDADPAKKPEKGAEIKKQVKNGWTLGHAIFFAKPKLSAFLCLLMIIGTMGIFLSTALCGEASLLFEPNYMFNHIDGRVVVAKQNGAVFSEDELSALKEEYGAESYLHFDSLLDVYSYIQIPMGENEWDFEYVHTDAVFGKDYGDDILGRYPEKGNEILLYLPISYQTYVGKDEILLSKILFETMEYDLVGVKYFYDNNLTAECLFIEEGFRTAVASHYIFGYSSPNTTVTVTGADGSTQYFELYDMMASFGLPQDKIYIDYEAYASALKELGADATTTVEISTSYYSYDYYYGSSQSYVFKKTLTDESIASEKPAPNALNTFYNPSLTIGAGVLREMAEEVLAKSYKQASLFFESDRAADAAAELLQNAGYIAVPSDTTYEPDAETVIVTVLSTVAIAFAWVMSVVFLAFFINLCSSRTLEAFKGDMAIMRSMGIPVRVIRIGMYVRMLISLIPAFLLVCLAAILIFTTPKFNAFFTYLYPWQYALIFAGMILLTIRTTHRQVKRLFGESVKKSLKGGNAE